MSGIAANYLEKCYAGWLGKVIGVRHGAPIEGWRYERIREVKGEIRGYLMDYRDFAADDDTNGPLFFLRALKDYTPGRDITAEQMGLAWLNYAPYEHGFYWWGGYGRSTEHTAYLNMRAGIPAPRSGSIEQNGATVAEQIGGQIFIDSWGLAVPGNPQLAAEYAGKAASVSHDGNGVYGGQFVAAAISAAFEMDDIREVLETALSVIPADCTYAVMTRDIFRYYDERASDDWRDCMEYIIANWGYDRFPGNCHIIPNSAVMVMSMLYGAGDYSRTINICNMAGWDTDCNVGNVGAIVGVMVGLSGIADCWRRPINDFLAASSVVGCLNIMNLPESVRFIASLAYQIQPGEVPEKYREFLAGTHRFDFALPGSTCAFRTDDADVSMAHDGEVFESGAGSLRVTLEHLTPGEERAVYHRTYYRPVHFTDSRYDPDFSPILYPGQRVTLRVCAGEGAKLLACAYALDVNSGRRYRGQPVQLVPGEWTTLTLDIPVLMDGCIEQAGLCLTPAEGCAERAHVNIDWMHFSGSTEYALDFSAGREEIWDPQWRRTPSQLTWLKGIWRCDQGALMGTCADFGEAYTGDIEWKDVQVSCIWTPSLGRTGFAMRVQGAIRSYAIFLEGDELSLCKNENGYRTLATCKIPLQAGEKVCLMARAVGNTMTVLRDGREILRYVDEDHPYMSGMVGMVLKDGGHALYHHLAVKAL